MTAKARAFISGPLGSIIIVLPHWAIDKDLTDIHLHGNLQDYYLKVIENTNPNKY